MFLPKKFCSEPSIKMATIQGNCPRKIESTIVIIPGENDNVTPPNSRADLNETNPSLSFTNVDNKTYTKMRVPNWYVEGYKTFDVKKAIHFMNRWVARMNSNDEENGETLKENVKHLQCLTSSDQGGVSRMKCKTAPATLPKPVMLKVKCSRSLKSKLQEADAAQNLFCSCDQTKKEVVQTPKETENCKCTPKKEKDIQGTCKCDHDNEILSKNITDKNEDNKSKLVKKPLKTKKDIKPKRSSKSAVNSKESKSSSDGKILKNSENSKTSKRCKPPKSSKTKESATNSSATMISQYSQTSLETEPQEISHQQPSDPNQSSSIAEITAYHGKSSIRKQCDASVLGQVLNRLFGSQLSDVDGIEIRRVRKEDSQSVFSMHKDQSTITVQSCCCQTELFDDRYDLDESCNGSEDIIQESNSDSDEGNQFFRVHEDCNVLDEDDDCQAKVYCSRSFVVQRSQPCLYAIEQVRDPVNRKVYPLYVKCSNCGRNKVSQNHESNVTLRSAISKIMQTISQINNRNQ